MPIIAIERLTKDYGAVRAVEDLSFAIEPGTITGFLGPNGSGKTTTLRALLGLVTPTAGRATILGRPYADLDDPQRQVGVMLEAAAHPARSGRDHMRALAVEARVPRRRADELLGLVELEGAADRRVGGYSLGMHQRLGLAGALLGDPAVLVLDEPANGLDPEGIRWLRGFLRSLAGDGRTILLSSHVLSEVAQTVDDVVVISGGRLVVHAPLGELTAPRGGRRVRVRSPQSGPLAAALRAGGLEVRDPEGDALTVSGQEPGAIADLALANGIALHEIAAETTNLEDTFLDLTTTALQETTR